MRVPKLVKLVTPAIWRDPWANVWIYHVLPNCSRDKFNTLSTPLQPDRSRTVLSKDIELVGAGLWFWDLHPTGMWLRSKLGFRLSWMRFLLPLSTPKVSQNKCKDTIFKYNSSLPFSYLIRRYLNSEVEIKVKVKIKWSRYRPGIAQRVGRGIALLFHGRGTRRGLVVSSTPRPHFTPGKDPVPILQEAGGPQGPSGLWSWNNVKKKKNNHLSKLRNWSQNSSLYIRFFFFRAWPIGAGQRSASGQKYAAFRGSLTADEGS